MVQPAMLDVIGYAPLQRVFQNILHAIEHRTVCLITYAAATKPVREHEMAPTNLMSGRQALYLHGWRACDKGSPEALHPLFLAVHRIKEVVLTRRVHQLEPPSMHRDLASWKASLLECGCILPMRLPPMCPNGGSGRSRLWKTHRRGTALSFPISPVAKTNPWAGC